MTAGSRLRIGFIEPHLKRYGGIRRVVEFANRLVARGHDVTFYLPEDQILDCQWMPCAAAISSMPYGFEDHLDVLIFNEESQWHLVDRFVNARRRVFYALHYAKAYDKGGAYESIRTPVDLQLANSNWTADQIEAETGHRPTVLVGGANRDVFRPYGGPKRYDILAVGDTKREWKGTDTILEAGRLLDRHVELYAPKDLSQPDLGREYDAARVFVVGSWFEGFCQPGLEAMACGVPLVTTDNGGCREYAIDGETALVVPPRDPVAMAGAIRRLLNDEVLAKELVTNGLDLVERDFDWERRTDVEVLPPFSAPPAAVIFVLPRDVVEGVGRWGEEYEVASGEDVDLAFKVWVNDLDIVYDQRVLVAHIGKGSASRLDDWKALWARNRRRFLDKWMGDEDVPRLPSCPPDRFARNRATAAAAAGWMDQYFEARDRPASVRQVIKHSPFEVRLQRLRTQARRQLGRNVRRVRRRAPGVVRAGRQVLDRLPPSLEQPLRAKLKRLAG